MDYQETDQWKSLEIKPLCLAEVPSGLEWCIYPEEKARGEVLCPKSVYMIVLALRWILTCTDSGLYDDFETWKVYWKSEGKYGFQNHIYLAKNMVEGYDYDDEYKELQPQTWIKLATLSCNNGKGIIQEVHVPAVQPYGGEYWWHLEGVAGVQRLLEDAIHASRATHNYQPIRRLNDGWTNTWRVQGNQDHDGWELDFKLECDHTYVTGIGVRTRKQYR